MRTVRSSLIAFTLLSSFTATVPVAAQEVPDIVEYSLACNSAILVERVIKSTQVAADLTPMLETGDCRAFGGLVRSLVLNIERRVIGAYDDVFDIVKVEGPGANFLSTAIWYTARLSSDQDRKTIYPRA